ARQIQPDATRMLTTGVLNLDTVVEAINKGEIYRFITKPWLREELLVAIQNAAQRYDLIRQNSQLHKSTEVMNERLVQLNRTLESAALLHDIGLVGVPRSLIKVWQETPETLTSAERALIEQHPILSQEMSAFGSGMDKVGEIIRAHHERFDGSGYPDGLAGE